MGSAYFNSYDLDLGRTGPDMFGYFLHNSVGLRFADVDIPYGSEIVSARIEFEAAPTWSGGLNSVLKLKITGEAEGNPDQFSNMPGDIRNKT